jgi:hypothetical protein
MINGSDYRGVGDALPIMSPLYALLMVMTHQLRQAARESGPTLGNHMGYRFAGLGHYGAG